MYEVYTWGSERASFEFVAPCDGYVEFVYYEDNGDYEGSDVDGYYYDGGERIFVDDKAVYLDVNDMFYDRVLDRGTIRDLEHGYISKEEVKQRAAPNLYPGTNINFGENWISDDAYETTVYSATHPNAHNLFIPAGSKYNFDLYLSLANVGDSNLSICTHYKIVFIPKS